MYRRTVHRWIAALALVAALGVMGAQPAAAADLSDLGIADRLASLWAAASVGPAALWETLSGWFGATKESASPAPPPEQGLTWSLDPNGSNSGGS
jgi:hypothetical protein